MSIANLVIWQSPTITTSSLYYKRTSSQSITLSLMVSFQSGQKEALWSTLKHSEAVWTTLNLSEAVWSSLKHSEALCSTLKHSEALWSTLKHSEALWSTLKNSEALWSTLKHTEPLWSTHIFNKFRILIWILLSLSLLILRLILDTPLNTSLSTWIIKYYHCLLIRKLNSISLREFWWILLFEHYCDVTPLVLSIVLSVVLWKLP